MTDPMDASGCRVFQWQLYLWVWWQFYASPTKGFCEAMGSGHIEEGYVNDTRLDGLNDVREC